MEKRLNFILINGPMGSGKSTIAKLLKGKLKRTAVFGGDEIKWFVSDFKRSKKDNLISKKVVYRMCDEYLKNDIDVLLAQGFYSVDNADELLRLAKKHKCNSRFYHLTAPRKVLLDRLSKRKQARDATKPIPRTRIIRNLRNHEKISYSNATIIDTSEMQPSEVVEFILKDIKKT